MLLDILTSVILPIFIIIGIGWLLDRRFQLDLPTLSKLNFYVFLPALLFVLLLKEPIDLQNMLTVGAFFTVHLLLLFALAWVLFSLRGLRERRTVMTLGSVLNNCGNYGIPLVLLAFGPGVVWALVVIIILNALFTFTAGVWMLERQARSTGSALANMARFPAVYAIVLALVMRWQGWRLPDALLTLQEGALRPGSLNYLADGLVGIALLTLGVQLSRAKLSTVLLPVLSVTGMRLIVSPLLALALLPFFRFNAELSAMLIVAAGFPVAVNLTILAAEYRQDEEMISQSIFFSTLLSAGTLAVILMLVR
jgi:predicted permease